MSRIAKSDKEAVEIDFHGAALIDDKGQEIAITEDMVRKAIHALDDAAYSEHSANEPSSDGRKS